MILVIDNYDSFTYNLVHYVGEIESNIKVIRNDECSISEVLEMKPKKIIISPGP
ncbi:MAG: glutamine amidotransferase-related protein, partial [Gammaproteobacteria bacterium]